MKIAPLLLAAALVVPAIPARAAETILGNKDLNLVLGYNLWLNQWTTAIPHSAGANNANRAENVSITQGGNAASNFTMTLRVKRFFTSLGYLTTPNYAFPRYIDATANNYDWVASRQEVDWNFGFMFVPQIGATMGYKGVTQKFGGKVNATTIATSKTYYNGVTFGILGSAPVGKGVSLYGNGAGGFMSVKYDPAPNTTTARNDTATYESAELGIAWKAPNAPLSAKFGYKFQKISTRLDEPNFRNQRAIDLTTGYILGLNLIF